MARGTYFAKDDMVLAGMELIPMIFADEQVEIRKHTGERAASGDGNARAAEGASPLDALATGDA